MQDCSRSSWKRLLHSSREHSTFDRLQHIDKGEINDHPNVRLLSCAPRCYLNPLANPSDLIFAIFEAFLALSKASSGTDI